MRSGCSPRNGTFLPDATVFAAEALTEGNAVLLQLLDADLGLNPSCIAPYVFSKITKLDSLSLSFFIFMIAKGYCQDLQR